MDDLTRDGIIRGQIIEAAKIDMSTAVSDLSLLTMLRAGGHAQTLWTVRGHIAYLSGAGKEYVEVDRRNPNLWLVKLLPKGRDLADGRIEDPAGGVIVRRD